MTDPSEQSEVPHSDGEETMDTSEPPATTTSPLAPAPETEEERDMSGDGETSVCVCVCHSPPHPHPTEDGGVDSGGEEEEGVDLKKMAEDYASYLVINSKQDVREMHTHTKFIMYQCHIVI